MNARRTMYKLQTALCAKGIRIKINQRQHWSDFSKRMLTRYIVVLDGDTLCETYHAHEVVLALADLLSGGGNE